MWPLRPLRGGRLAAGAAAALTLALAAADGGDGLTLAAEVAAAPTTPNQALLALMPAAAAPYRLPLALRSGHSETIFAALFRRKPHLLYKRELLHMPDGGCVCLDTEDLSPEKVLLVFSSPRCMCCICACEGVGVCRG